MHPRRTVPGALILALVTVLLAAAPAAAQTVPTAEWNPATSFSTYSLFGFDGSRNYEGMTWLATETGLLSTFSIRVWTEAAPTPDQEMLAWLYEAADGKPTGPILATASAPPTDLQPGGAVMLSFDFSAANALIEAGRHYAVAVGPANLYTEVVLSMNGSTGDPYPDGNAFDSFDLGATWRATSVGIDYPFQAMVDQTGVPVVAAGFGRLKAGWAP